MKISTKIALLLGVATALGGAGLGFAQMEGPEPPEGPMAGLIHDRGRLADRLLADFDRNHDGRVTHEEMNSAIYARFTAATHGAKEMTEDQFAALHNGEFREHATEMFHRLDWKGTGKLTLEDYAGPERARFMALDRQGAGVVSCARSTSSRSSKGHRSTSAHGGYALAAFCADNDINMDGNVTRAELDSAVAKRFSAASHGASFLTLDAFIADQSGTFRAANERTFHRLDKNHDGKLTLAEFAQTEEKAFARLDKNKDGVIEPDELHAHSHRTRKSKKS